MAPGNRHSSSATNNINRTPHFANSRVPDVVDANGGEVAMVVASSPVVVDGGSTTHEKVASVGGGTTIPMEEEEDGGTTTPVEVAAVGGGSTITTVEEAVMVGRSSSGNGGEGGSGSGNNAVGPVMCVGGSNQRLSWSTALDKGRRVHMEDEIACIPNFMCMPCNQFGGCTSPDCHYAAENSQIHYFAVFDGHSGGQVSAYCARTLHEIIRQEWSDESGANEWVPKWQTAFSRAYERIDDECKGPLLASAGSTAVVVLLSSCQIIAANCGDSRAVLVRRTETVPLTNDHKPNRIDEAERIRKDRGCILNVGGVLRVGGVLAMTRAIGDQFLKPWVSSVPEITFTTRSEDDEYLIIASDGVWDVMTTNEVGVLARPLIRQMRRAASSGVRSSLTVANLIRREARLRRSGDNISVIAVDMKPLRRRHPVQP